MGTAQYQFSSPVCWTTSIVPTVNNLLFVSLYYACANTSHAQYKQYQQWADALFAFGSRKAWCSSDYIHYLNVLLLGFPPISGTQVPSFPFHPTCTTT